MYKHLTKTSTRNMTHDEWLEHRRRSIGGSDAASIIGINPWSSPLTVWADKMGKLPPKEDNEPMRLGRDLEEYVAKRFTEATGKKVRRENYILVNPDYPFAHANVDRLVVGEDAGLECKTTSSLNLKRFKNGEYPEQYYVQAVHYMMVTGCKKWYIAVLVLGVGFYHFEVERDEDEIYALGRAEQFFWEEYVSKSTPPPTDGKKSTSESISAIYTESNDETIDISSYESDINQYMSYVSLIKDLEHQKDEIANRIKAFLGESGKGSSANYNVSWTSSQRSSFDHKGFSRDHPTMDLSGYYKTTLSRTFKITKNN